MKNIKNQINDVDSKNDYSLSKSLCLLLIIFTVSIVIRLYYLPFDLPLLLDAQHYFWYANDMSILKEIPTHYSSHNNFWASFLSIFFSVNSSDNILDYMNTQRILSTVLSSLTIFPLFFLCKKFFLNKYSLLGSLFFIFDPRLIINSLQGITEPIYFLIVISIILFSFSDSKKFYYISFGLAAILSLIRYEGLIILVPLTIIYFWKFEINKKSILTYSLCILIFILVLFPMVEARIHATGHDGIISHISGGAATISNTLAGNETGKDRVDIKNSLINSLSFLGWITIPIWIIFLPYGLFKYFKKFDQKKSILLLFSVILILPALYAYSRDFQETRYLYILFPLFSIISLYSIQNINQIKNFKIIFVLIIFGIIFSSIGWLEYKWIDEEYEKEVFTVSLKIKDMTTGINEFYPESTYLQFIDLEKKFPNLKNEVKHTQKIIQISQHHTIEELLVDAKEQGLTHLVIDESQKQDNLRKEFLIEIYKNENKYNFLKKIYDSNNDGFNYKLKIFEIDYKLFNQYMGK
jgi:uncharacterized protein YnzC (UPF0291/DUF896 family)